MNERDPETPILVAADASRQQKLILDALDAGADEVVGPEVLRIPALARRRVRSALANVRGTSADAWAALPTGPDDLDDGAVVEWEDGPTEAEAEAARARVRQAVARLPTREERSGPLAELLGVTVPELRAPSGRLDAKRIAACLGVSLNRFAAAMPVRRQSLDETPDSARIQAALDPFARALAVLDVLLPGDVGRQWLNAIHPGLDGTTPLAAMLDGRAERVARLLEMIRDGSLV